MSKSSEYSIPSSLSLAKSKASSSCTCLESSTLSTINGDNRCDLMNSAFDRDSDLYAIQDVSSAVNEL